MNKPFLSIIIPAIPGRISRLKAIISRLNLSASLAPHIPFELVIADGGSQDETKELVQKAAEFMPIKYIYLPIGDFINAAYPRNVAIRICEGEVIGHLDIDHWPGENIIEGMSTPFLQLGLDKIINRGYVIDSSKSQYEKGDHEFSEFFNKPMLSSEWMNKCILGIYEYAKIPPPGVNNTLWIWAVKRKYILSMNAYDENYCRAYCREDDDFRERLLAQCLSFYDGQNKKFCSIHLWHKAIWRSTIDTGYNKKYFLETCCPVKEIIRNKNKEWGKMLEYSFSIIGGVSRNPLDHEKYIRDNVYGVKPYIDNPTTSLKEIKHGST